MLVVWNIFHNNMSGWWFGTWLLFSIINMGCHPNPIDELHHFSRWAHCTTKQQCLEILGLADVGPMT